MATQPNQPQRIQQAQQARQATPAPTATLDETSSVQQSINLPNQPQVTEVPGAGQVTGVAISQIPRPLSGAEVAGLLVYEVAEKLAQGMARNGRLSELARFNRYKLRFRAQMIVESLEDPKGDNVAIPVEQEFEVDLTKINLDYYRAQTGMGLWHEGRQIGTGTVVEFRQQPIEAVLKHLAALGPLLVREEDTSLGGLVEMMAGQRR
jgi:hypothetical protein